MKKKVLIYNDELQFGGSDLVAVRLEENLDKSEFECTYCVRHSQAGPLEPLVAARGVRIIHIPDESLSYYGTYSFFKKLFTQEHFDIVHSHLLFNGAIVLKAAAECGVPVRAAHSHFTKPLTEEHGVQKLAATAYRSAMRRLHKKYATLKIGCTRQAGEYLFGKKEFEQNGIVLNNGIDFDEYRYNPEYRKEIRAEFSVPDGAVLLGHIGQMWEAKNHMYLLDIFYTFHSENPDSYLMLVSDGPMRSDIENKVNALGLEQSVIFTDFRTDCNKLLCAMDCFVFPSLHEGFPLTLIEAQASGLPCIVSDRITRAVKLNDNLTFCPLEYPPEKWTEKINALLAADRESVDCSRVKDDFDIKRIAKKLEELYLA